MYSLIAFLQRPGSVPFSEGCAGIFWTFPSFPAPFFRTRSEIAVIGTFYVGKFFFNVQISASERSVFNLSKIEPRPLFWLILSPSEARIPIKHHHRSASFHGYERINLLATHSTRMAAGNLRFSLSFLEEAKHIDSRIPVSLFAGFPLEEHAEP